MCGSEFHFRSGSTGVKGVHSRLCSKPDRSSEETKEVHHQAGLEKPKLPSKKTGEDPSKGGSAQDLLKGQADPVPQQSSDPTPSADPTPTADPVPSSSHYTRSRDPKSVKIRKAGSGTGDIISSRVQKTKGLQRRCLKIFPEECFSAKETPRLFMVQWKP